VTLMAVVKADGYGHGAVRVALTALANGAEQLAVANIEEATILRDAGITVPILILGYVDPSAVAHCITHDLTVTVYDADLAREHDARARAVGKPLRIHAKIDTGMGRLGMLPSEAAHFLAQVLAEQHTHLALEGIYTHFSVADEDPAYTAEQVRVFRDTINSGRTTHTSSLRNLRLHVANSAGTLASADNHFNLVRVGLALYGLSPSDSVLLPPDFRPALTWKTVIASVKMLPPGHVVGYGNTYITQGEERIAVLPVGYADGFRRAPAHYGEVLVRGCRAPIVGRVSMEKTMIRVDHIPDVQIGDEVVLLGAQGSECITAEDIARRLGTINYEVVCSVLPRVARTSLPNPLSVYGEGEASRE
jgi:alanine racemase